jgi:hypothetical protein
VARLLKHEAHQTDCILRIEETCVFINKTGQQQLLLGGAVARVSVVVSVV